MGRGRALLAAAFAALVAACATNPGPAPETRPLNALPGWAEEDHASALAAMRSSCLLLPHRAEDGVDGGGEPHAPRLRLAPSVRPSAGPATSPVLFGTVEENACAKSRSVKASQARAFLEQHYRAEPVSGEGLLTAYFAPVYPARERREPSFTAPVRPIDDRTQSPRARIEAAPAPGARAWLRPEDLFFLQIQGSGVLVMPDGRRLRAAFAAHNGQPFVGLANVMRERGLLADDATSADNIRAWLAAHRGPEADALMRENPRYVFFGLEPDDGAEPKGAAGISLPPGRAIAIDRAHHAFGGLYWIEAETPALTGARPAYRRLVAALDTGGAIKGPVRADLYLGTGEAAGREAGTVRHRLRMWRLAPARP